ncbi:hypothetical protein BUALT_Bualt16G0029800 [Buddleja alternifolia]|uniref:Transmembrane protein 220 n=1 Tax=Buddleja alternifolia TaxID=168488 RepID=A0AAV6WJF4_9LAMI|nr:hypothetical protein BUALT_Bualt16G0029800 [Buddleja alternifolia]
MAEGSNKLLGICYMLLASHFAVSASFQLNDPDWYFWIPLYASACVVNLVNWAKAISSRSIRKLAKFGFWIGVSLFIKVTIESLLHGRDKFWSIDMRDRIVRERFGSGLVICSMFLHLDSSSDPNHPTRVTKYGVPVLVGIAYGLSFVFFVFQHEEIRY